MAAAVLTDFGLGRLLRWGLRLSHQVFDVLAREAP